MEGHSCKTEKELAEAIKNNEDTIIVEGNLKNGVIRIKAVGKASWGVCAALLGVGITIAIVTLAAPPAAPPAAGAQAFVAAPVIAILGPASVTAITLGICAGGVGVLTTLRDKYKIVEKNDKYITLKKK